MWIENLPDGRFKFRERYKDPLTGKSFKVVDYRMKLATQLVVNKKRHSA